MHIDTQWTIQIDPTEFKADDCNENLLRLSIDIHINLPINRSPLANSAVNPITLKEIRLYNRSDNSYIDSFEFHEDRAVWSADGERAWRTYSCTLTIKNKNCFSYPIKRLEDALSIEIYDSTSGETPWFFKLARLLESGNRPAVITVNH